jgi:hypothetical protein
MGYKKQMKICDWAMEVGLELDQWKSIVVA